MSLRTIEQMSSQLDELESVDKEDQSIPICRYSALVSLSKDIDSIRKKVYEEGAVDNQLHFLDKRVQDMMFEAEYKIGKMYEKRMKEQQQRKEEEEQKEREKEKHLQEGGEVDKQHGQSANESISTLRKRLLATTDNETELDAVQTTEYQNNYHETLQEGLLESLPSMVSGIREQALQFQDMLKQDAVILKEATENFEKSHGRFGVVNDMLAKYHKEGKLGIFFYIRVIAMVLVGFLVLIFLIRLIPERH